MTKGMAQANWTHTLHNTDGFLRSGHVWSCFQGGYHDPERVARPSPIGEQIVVSQRTLKRAQKRIKNNF